jgi:hypothetical protein
VEVSPRDIMYTLDAKSAADTEPQVLITTELRCGGVQWGDDNLALVYERCVGLIARLVYLWSVLLLVRLTGWIYSQGDSLDALNRLEMRSHGDNGQLGCTVGTRRGGQ